MTPAVCYAVVVPTVGRRSLAVLLDALAGAEGPRPRQVVVVDDRARPSGPLPTGGAGLPVTVRRSGGRGPAAARNVGWRSVDARWVAFLDDDVVVSPRWAADLAADLAGLPEEVGGSQGRISVPGPVGRRPTDWERNVAGLETACWATADLAYRRDVLEEVGGFDERFPRAYREDADLGLRVHDAGYLVVRGARVTVHPPGPAGRGKSVSLQAGNADDALMRALHGPEWRRRAAAGPARTGRHVATVAAAATAVAVAAAGRRWWAAGAVAAWAGLTGEFFWARTAPGPRHRDELLTLALTSAAIPPVAVAHRLAGTRRARQVRDRVDLAPLGRAGCLRPSLGRAPSVGLPGPRRPVRAVLFDRDGTLVVDRPYNGDPDAVRLMPGARRAVASLRSAGVALGVVTNQSGVGRGRLGAADVAAVNRRVDELLGGLGTWALCPHAPDQGCGCRKPAPGLVKEAAVSLGVDPADCVVIGDIGADVEAAAAAGARAVLVPTAATRPDEIRDAPAVAPTLVDACHLVLAEVP